MLSAFMSRKQVVNSAKGGRNLSHHKAENRAEQGGPGALSLPWAPNEQSPGLVTSCFHSLLAEPSASLDFALGIRAGLVCAAGAGGMSCRDKLK